MRIRLIILLLLAFAFTSTQAAVHPRLYFSATDIPHLTTEATGAKALQFQRLQAWGDSHLDDPVPQNLGVSEFQHETAFSAITGYGLLWTLTGQKKYLLAARRWLDALLDTPTASQGNYHIGIFAASLAHGYDFLYGGLDTAFRKRLREKAFDVMQEARRGADNSWWAHCYLHHDFWIPVAGLGIAALAFRDECSGADSLAAFCTSELQKATGLLGPEGYWPEGVADWVYGMAPTFMYYDALRRAGGPDLYENDWYRNTAFSRLLHWCPDDSYMFLGDSYRSGRYGTLGSASAHVLMRLAARFRDRHAQWLAGREARVDSAGPPGLSFQPPYALGAWNLLPGRQVHGLAWQFLWYDPSLAAAPPDSSLSTDCLFPNWDTAILRAGWDEQSPVLAFCGGHQLGTLGEAVWRTGAGNLDGGLAHVHQSAGSVFIWADGAFPLCPASFGGRDGRFQNTVLVDGCGQAFDPAHRGHMTAFESGKNWTGAVMDVTAAYHEALKLERFERMLVYLKPRTVVIRDRLVSRDGNRRYIRRYEWLLHTDPEVAEWRAAGDSLAATSRAGGRVLIEGRVFPSEKYFFERQSLDRPDTHPVSRGLSLTLTGPLPPEVEIAAVLVLPATADSAPRLSGAKCMRLNGTTALLLPAAEGEPSRAVLFTATDTLYIHAGVWRYDLVLALGLKPGVSYRAEKEFPGPEGGFRLIQDSQGRFRSGPSGCLVLKQPE